MHEVFTSGTVGSDFHPLLVCSCGKCEKDDLKCPGKEYQSTNVLICPLHALAHEIECNHRADHASEIIDPELGRGHSNACEATFTIFPKFRPKDIGLQRLHYQASTNLSLIQSLLTYLSRPNMVQTTTGYWISLSRWASLCLME